MVLRLWVQRTLLALAAVAYVGANYFAAVVTHPPLILVLLGLVPLAAIALTLAWQSKWRRLALALCAACAVLMAVNFEMLRSHVAWLYFIQHAGAMSLLCIAFGSTLGRSHADALCSRIASLLLGPAIDAEYLRFTWKVTMCWTAFFAATAIISIALFSWASMEVWSFFANVLTPVLLGVMFIGEYLIRVQVLPNRAHFKVGEIIKAYRRYSHRQKPG